MQAWLGITSQQPKDVCTHFHTLAVCPRLFDSLIEVLCIISWLPTSSLMIISSSLLQHFDLIDVCSFLLAPRPFFLQILDPPRFGALGVLDSATFSFFGTSTESERTDLSARSASRILTASRRGDPRGTSAPEVSSALEPGGWNEGGMRIQWGWKNHCPAQ